MKSGPAGRHQGQPETWSGRGQGQTMTETETGTGGCMTRPATGEMVIAVYSFVMLVKID